MLPGSEALKFAHTFARSAAGTWAMYFRSHVVVTRWTALLEGHAPRWGPGLSTTHWLTIDLLPSGGPSS